MSVVYFGVRWDAPHFDEAVEVPTPVGEKCLYCREPVVEGESGTLMPVGQIDGPGTVEPVHIECFLRSTIGDVAHLEGRCTCYGGGDRDERPYRVTARETMEWVVRNTVR